MRNLAAWGLLLSATWVCAGLPRMAAAAEGVDYLRDVKPILHERCYACHGALKQEGSLRLDTGVSIQKGGDSGPAIVASQAAESLLIKRISAADLSERMPPEGKPLTPDQIAKITAWVASGAAIPAGEQPEVDPNQHWAFLAPVRPAVPEIAGATTPLNPIDAFLTAERQKHGVTPVGPVEKSLLLRRLYMDLIGLPPTRTQLHVFLADQRPNAYELVVDELLASPQYGERWGRHWMDVWRYTDWFGLGDQLRNSQKHIWHWRDWMIESLNADKGYDQMVVEMLAADELYPTDQDKLRASGFLARNYFLFNRTSWLDETVEHTSKAFLGLTLNCTKCHDHKYDPITQVEYYQMRAIFEPHQVRLDPMSGETDLEKNGLPRVFDAHLDVPTYLHIRGDEKNPDKAHPISPGVPAILGTASFQVSAVSLPAEAYQPVLRSFVLGDQLKSAEKELATARTTLTTAQTNLATAEKTAAEAAAKLAAIEAERKKSGTPAPTADLADDLLEAGKLVFEDNFDTQNPEWKLSEGMWKFENGSAVQSQDGDVRATMRLQKAHPADFHTKLKFKITGGKQWKSVGFSFDVAEQREKLVYMSAYQGGNKLQIAYKNGAAYVYPPRGEVARSVELNHSYELECKVRDRLVNILIDGQPALAYTLPVGREPGQLVLITYDAAAELEHFELRELPPEAKLTPAGPAGNAAGGEAGQTPGVMTVAEAKLGISAAERAVAAAEVHAEAIRAVYAAEAAKAAQKPAEELKALTTEAALASRKHELAVAKLKLATAEQALAVAKDEKATAAAEKARAAAQENVTKAEQAVMTPGNQYPALRVSLKALEGPDENEASRYQPFPATSTGRRSALAKWIVRRDNPLAARVAVNHLWLRHFGQPLVETVDDFGRRALQPAQQPLLDWLAVELMDNQWSMKRLHRLMVTSQAYQLSTSSLGAIETTVQADPDNKYFWRRRPIRVESQLLRDSLLHLAGQLDLTIGGPTIPPSMENQTLRRSLYFTHSRDDRSDFLSMFDDADILSCYRRSESIIPQQALTMANSRLSLQMAREITQKLQKELGAVDDETFVVAAFETVLSNQPDAEEKAACLEMLTRTREAVKAQNLTEVDSRARHDLIHALLNHNDFVTIR